MLEGLCVSIDDFVSRRWQIPYRNKSINVTNNNAANQFTTKPIIIEIRTFALRMYFMGYSIGVNVALFVVQPISNMLEICVKKYMLV